MHRMSSKVESVVSAYKQLAKIPALMSGRLSKAGKNVSSLWSVRNLDRGKITKFAFNSTLDDELNVIAESEFGTDVSTELLSAVSPGDVYRAVVREYTEKDAKRQLLEVWRSRTLEHSIDLTALDVHGDVYTDSEFKSLDWSPDLKSIVYIAERKLLKSEPYIKRKDESKIECEHLSLAKGEEHVYKQDWGEQLVGKHLSVIAVCDLETETVKLLSGLPDSWCPGQVQWSPDGRSVVGVAWETEPRRLGLIFCTNRPSYIFSLTLDGQHRKISGEGLAVRSPRWAGAGRLVWLQRPAGGPHHACHQLVYVAWPLKDQNPVLVAVDTVGTEVQTANGRPFRGIYCLALPERCAAADGRLVFATQQRTQLCSYVVQLDTGRLVDITDSSGSTTILDIQNDIILGTRTSLRNPSQLIAARLPSAGSEGEVSWRAVSAHTEVPAAVQRWRVEHLVLDSDDGHPVSKFSALYFGPPAGDAVEGAGSAEEGARVPLVVWPHGGPHAAFADAYSLEAALFAMLGFACLQINYRGSTGDGQASVESLPGRAGAADVADCLLAAASALEGRAAHAGRLALFGGSHGGFLVTHLAGQHPEMFACVVTRNPVTDVAAMFGVTDIADWCAVEAGYEFTEAGPASEEQLVAMRRASPLAHAHRVRAPTALMLGAVDRRVPYYQGLDYHRRLRANGCVTKLFLYDDNHSLSTLAVEMDNLINSILWFQEHMK